MILVLEWHTNFAEPVVGDKIVVADSSLSLVRPFNSNTDSEADVFGIVLAKSCRAVQLANGFDGPLYALYGPYITNEDLSQPVDDFGAQQPNPDVQPIQPFSDSRLIFVATSHAFGAVKKPYTGTPIVLVHHTNYDWCLV